MNHSRHRLIRHFLANLQVNVTAMSYNQVWSDWRELDYTPDYNKFYLICEGEGWLKIDGSEYYPIPGQWFLMPQGVKQSYSVTDGPRYTKYWCHFTAKIGENNLFDLLKTPYFIDTCNDREPERLFRDLLSNWTSDFATSPLLLKASLYNLIAYYLEHAYGSEDGIRLDAAFEPLQSVIAYIHSHYRDNLTVRNLADRVHLHPNYFIRVFKRHFGTSPIQFVNNKRIEEAKWLLTTTNLTLAEIGRSVGIPDVSYLSKLFKTMTGFSPSAYRQSNHLLQVNKLQE
ncbi:AraC family transcriptional regulator [Cohnella yongneupensis]|uniref:AraC family transcriptional regulator n=1 Tax=Cohnella yongneupensis TaxID=425006 RepID=A0ABW0QU52_9BACL